MILLLQRLNSILSKCFLASCAECRDHGVSLEGSAGAEGPHHQPGAHLPEAAPAGVSPDVLFVDRGPRGVLPSGGPRVSPLRVAGDATPSGPHPDPIRTDCPDCSSVERGTRGPKFCRKRQPLPRSRQRNHSVIYKPVMMLVAVAIQQWQKQDQRNNQNGVDDRKFKQLLFRV